MPPFIGTLTLILLIFAVCWFHVLRQKKDNQRIYAEKEAELAEWREEALVKGKQAIFSDQDRRDLTRILKGEGLNRKQRRGKAKQYGKEFVEQVKGGFE